MTTPSYDDFLSAKLPADIASGFDTDRLNHMLFDWQEVIERWALKRGRAAIFADCGMGKSPLQLEWSNQVHRHTGKDILIVAPLAVSAQTKREGEKFGIPVNIAKMSDNISPGINITNYERLHHFDDSLQAELLDDLPALADLHQVMQDPKSEIADIKHAVNVACREIRENVPAWIKDRMAN